MSRFCIAAAFFGSVLMASGVSAKVDYHLNKVADPSADELDAYEHIAAAMDSAVFMYNKYTHMTKHIEVYYNTGVQTADASYNGTMRFGSNRSYMKVRTAMHEMGHTMGMGTTSEYTAMLKDGVFQGETAQAKLKELTGDPAAVLKGDSQHFWPYGLNYDSELHSEEDLIIHCQVVEAMYQDIFKEAFYMTARVKYMPDDRCIGITAANGLEMMDCSGDATVAKIWSIGDDPVTYRFEFGDRVIDVPNESTAAGVVLSTYSWNAGAHQRYVLEGAPVNGTNAFYLQNYKSKLYLMPSGNSVVQDVRGRDVESGVWILQNVELESGDTVAVDSDSSVTDTSKVDSVARDSGTIAIKSAMPKPLNVLLPIRNFDAMGRTVRQSRRQAKYLKLF